MSGITHRVLFVCIHNSARSQMAEAFLRKYGQGRFESESAGIEPGKMNPVVVTVMKEEGIDLTDKKTQGVSALIREGRRYDLVITVCDEASAERCPVFPGEMKRLTWSFEDPSSFKGSETEIIGRTRSVKDQIKQRVENFVAETEGLDFWKK